MAENGEVYFLHRNGTYLAGSDIEQAPQSLIETSGPMTDLWEYYELDVVEESGWRFNERTTAILLGGGWAVGRDLGALADEMIASAVEGAGALGYHDGTRIELVGTTMDEAVSHWLQDYPLTEIADSVTAEPAEPAESGAPSDSGGPVA
jgi:hypothetical protein